MDTEEVINRVRAGIAQALEWDEDMDSSGWNSQEGVLMPGNHARALLTEIDYWRARCGAAEQLMGLTPIHNVPDKETSEALSRWQRAVCGSADSDGKARYLETIKTSPVE